MDRCLLKLFSESVYGDIRAYWQNECPPDDKERICKCCENKVFASYLYRYLHDLLPADYKTSFRQYYTNNSLRAVRYQKVLNDICQLFEQNQVRFCILKGGDWAYNHYPDPAMRYFCDLDIWFHPDDCKKMLALLKENGWEAPYLSTDQFEEHHHYTPHTKNGITIEPHWTLHLFAGHDPIALWENHLTVEPAWNYRYQMSPELKILQLCRHFASNEYRHLPIYKFLLDVAWILKKESIDWEKLRSLSAEYHFESCNDLLGSQIEFFPAEMIEAISPDPEMAETFRKLFELQNKLPVMTNLENQMQTNTFFSRLWLLARFRGIAPLAVRKKYKLAEKGDYFALYRYTVYDICTKIISVIKSLFHRSPVKKEYNRLLQKISSRSK